jgi:hypothetical protein
MKTKREPLIPWLAITVVPSLIVCGSVVMAVAGEPLGTVPPGAFVLDQGWQTQSSAVTVTNLPAGTHRIAVGDGSGHTITIPVTSSSRGNK